MLADANEPPKTRMQNQSHIHNLGQWPHFRRLYIPFDEAFILVPDYTVISANIYVCNFYCVLFHREIIMSSSRSGCLNNPDAFCYICGDCCSVAAPQQGDGRGRAFALPEMPPPCLPPWQSKR